MVIDAGGKPMVEEAFDPSESPEGAMQKVTTFLDGERARRRSARRTWLGLLGLLAAVGALHGMTVAGWLSAEGRDLIASAGAVGFGILAQQ
jgi:hypothetical protein